MSAEALTARFRVPDDHPALPGHFPGHPLVPGVVILDHVLALLGDPPATGLCLPRVKFLRPLRPGMLADIRLLASVSGGLPTWRFEVSHAGALVASGDIAVRAATP